MAKLLLLSLLCLILLAKVIHGQKGCFEEERASLLKFKAIAQSTCPYYADDIFPSWDEDDPESDCCTWEGVTCTNHTRHVIELSLGHVGFGSKCEGNFPSPLNISLFNSFKKLKVFELSTKFMGWITADEGCNNFLRLEHLETLNLYRSVLQNRSSLCLLSHLTCLKHLNLGGNQMAGSIPVQDAQNLFRLRKLEDLHLGSNSLNIEIVRLLISGLPSLRYLILSYNSMKGSLSNQDLEITSTRLEILDLSDNNIVGNIPSNVGRLTSLKALSLANNAFNGSLPIPGLCELEKLEELDLSSNSFGGMIPPCLSNMKSLQIIDLSDNHFEGSFAVSYLANHSKLEMIALTCGGNKLKITDDEYLDHNPLLYQLKYLKLSNCDLNNIPYFLHHQHQLRGIDLSHNKLNGTFPTWLLENNNHLEFLNLRNNSFAGQFYVPISAKSNMVWLDVSRNDLSGQLQEDFGRILSNSYYINLSSNHLEGDLPSSICTGNKLEVLDLSWNNFTGEVPMELVTYCTNLDVLLLADNKFQGEIFSAHYFNLSSLSYLDLSNNQFTGSLAKDVRISTYIDILDISNNQMTGEIPSWICDLMHIGMLSLRRNSFEGQFPCKEQLITAEYMDLSYNSLSGSLPYCFDQSLKLLNLQGNKFSGTIPSALFDFSALKVLNLRGNNLSGSIPDLTRTIPSLRVLSLAHNYLGGLIPKEFCDRLKNISTLDLSNNLCSGPIPPCFSNIIFGEMKHLTLREDTTDWITLPPSYQIGGRYLKQFLTFADIQERKFGIDFVTKNNLYAYVGDMKYLMSGLDLSCNNLTGQIPSALGNLASIRALNLSHNRLVGSIPTSFLNLAQVESLDLSFNHLSGKIPLELTNLNFLQVFNVTHNNLSGKIPDTSKLSTFPETSFKENPLLCGLQLNKSCSETLELPIVPLEETHEKWFEVDSTAFYASFAVTYVMFLLTFVTVLFINPYWRRRWFLFVEHCMYSSYNFVRHTLGKLSAKFRN